MNTKHHLIFLLSIFLIPGITNSQVLKQNAFKGSKTIRIYVKETSKIDALTRFASYINDTGFEAFIPGTKTKEETKSESNDVFQPKLAQIKQAGGSRQTGDTIFTNLATLYDTMMGDYTGRLKFYPSYDENDNVYIEVTGFVSNSDMGGTFHNLQMQNAGKGANWAQKSLFKQVQKHLLKYPDVNRILYSDQ